MNNNQVGNIGVLWILAVSLCAVAPFSGAAEQERDAAETAAPRDEQARPAAKVDEPQTKKQPARRSKFIYRPPLRGAPQVRVGGGTRGTADQVAILQVLAPDHVGLTTQAQPTLYWYAHTPVAAHFEFALIDDEGIEPLLEIEAGSEKVSGIQQIDLGDHGISLAADVPYQWSVALVTDETSRSADVIASGVIERIEPGEGLVGRIRRTEGENLVGAYASEGIWYDALQTISEMIAKAPGDRNLRSIRASLLEQVGLPVVAAQDMSSP
jgi:hypothetical protein